MLNGEGRVGEMHRAPSNDGFGHHEEIRGDVQDRGFGRAARSVQIVGQAASPGAQDQEMTEVSWRVLAYGVESLLVLTMLVSHPAPVPIEVVKVLDDPAWEPTPGCPREGTTERGVAQCGDVK